MTASYGDVLHAVVLLEYTEFPPCVAAIQNAVRLPARDFTTAAKWIHNGCLCHPFTGRI